MGWTNVVAMDVLRNTFSTKTSRIFRFWIYFQSRDIDGYILGYIIKVRAHDSLYIQHEMKRRLNWDCNIFK